VIIFTNRVTGLKHIVLTYYSDKCFSTVLIRAQVRPLAFLGFVRSQKYKWRKTKQNVTLYIRCDILTV